MITVLSYRVVLTLNKNNSIRNSANLAIDPGLLRCALNFNFTHFTLL